MSEAEQDNATDDSEAFDGFDEAFDALEALEELEAVEDKTQAIQRVSQKETDEDGEIEGEAADDTPSPDATPSPEEAPSAALKHDTDTDTVALSQCVVPASAAESEVAAAEAAEAAEEALTEAQQSRDAARIRIEAARSARDLARKAVEESFSQDDHAVRIARDALQKAVGAKEHADRFLRELVESQRENSERWDDFDAQEQAARESVASLQAEAAAAKAEAEERLAEQESVQARSKQAEQEAESKAKAAEKVRALVAQKEKAAKDASRVAKRAENDARVAAAAVAEAMTELEELKDRERRAATAVARAAASVMDNEEAVETAEEEAKATETLVKTAEQAAQEARGLLDAKRQSMATGELSPEEISEIALAIGTLAGEAKSKQQEIESAKARVEEANDSIAAARDILATSQKTARKQQTTAEKAAATREEAGKKLEELKQALATARKVADDRTDAADLVREEARQAAEDVLTEVSRDGAEAVAKAEETASAWRSAARQYESARARSDALQRQLRQAEKRLAEASGERAEMQEAQGNYAQRLEQAEAAVRSSAERAWRAETRLDRLENDARTAAEEFRPALVEVRHEEEAEEEVDGDATDFNLGLGEIFGEEEVDTMRFDREKLEAAGLSEGESGGAAIRSEDEGTVSFWLTISTAEGLQGKHEFERDVISIGRDPNCDVFLDNMLVSRRHAEIRRRGDFFALVDLGTSNGTLLNGSKVTGLTILNNGDGIGVGKFRIRFEADFASAFGMPSADSSVSGEEADLETIGGMTLRMTPETQQRVHDESSGKSLGCVVIRDPTGKEARSPVSETFLIGKSPNCDLRLRGWFIPRKAAMIVRGLANYKVENLSDSPSSILVNGKPVATRATLSDGDTIEVYGQRVGFSLPKA